MRAYYGSRFSRNMTATPEGFLICHNVPIARTGWYDYLGEELGLPELTGKVVKVYRSPEAVFSPAAIASFEGKILTDEHPTELVTPENATRYTKGAVQNVRRGSGDENDLLIADLVVYDQLLISEIQEGKREVSCGYDCVYEDAGDGTYLQQEICGNHVAVVTKGRAGDRVAIKDHITGATPKGESKMPKIVLPKMVSAKEKPSFITNFLAAVGLKHFAADAEPEDIMDAVNAMAEEREAHEEGEDDPKKEPAKDTQDPAVAALSEQVSKLTEIVTKLVENSAKPEVKPEDAIDAVIAELEKTGGQASGDDEEESHTIPAEQMDDEGPVSDPEERPKSALTGDNAFKIAALRAIKPIIAQIPDPAQRKLATDAAIASIKGKPAKNTYADIAKGPKKPAADQQPAANGQKQKDPAQLGRDIARKHNPHYKNRA